MKIRKILKRISLYSIVLILLLLIIAVSPYIWNNLVTYPRLQTEKEELYAKYKRPVKYISQNEYKGVFHMHTYWSHDSRGTLDEILKAATRAEYDFLFLSDHPRSRQDTFPRGYSGTYNDIIVEPGTENSNGFMISPLRSTVLDWDRGDEEVIRDVVDNNGLVIYVHTEKPHNWENRYYQAMEIYNIHTDYLDGNDSFFSIIMNMIFNKSEFHQWVFREMYDEQNEIMKNWDRLNNERRIVGVAGVDAHNNQSYRARYAEDGKVEWIGPNAKLIDVVEPGMKENLLLNNENIDGWAFKWEVDPYYISFNHVANHVFSDTLSNRSIMENLISGHSFISFQSLAAADGFQYLSVDENNEITGIVGDSVSSSEVMMLKAFSPFPARFELIKNGSPVDFINNVYEYQYGLNDESGNYRLVVKLYYDDEWISWIITNPIYIN